MTLEEPNAMYTSQLAGELARSTVLLKRGPTHALLSRGQGGIDRDSIPIYDEVCYLDSDLLDCESNLSGGQVRRDILDEVVLTIRLAVDEAVRLQPDEGCPNLFPD